MKNFKFKQTLESVQSKYKNLKQNMLANLGTRNLFYQKLAASFLVLVIGNLLK